MARTRLPVVTRPESLPSRIATGLQKIGLALKHQSWKQANEDGLSPTQGQLLALLASEHPQRASELAARLGLTLPTVSDSVAALVDKHLVLRRPDPRHPRASLLEPTAAGRAAATRARAWPDFLATAVDALTPAEQKVFHTGLVKMIGVLQQDGRIPLQRMCVSCTYFRPHAHDGPQPHHCAFIDAPLAAVDLRLDCDDHVEAPAPERAKTLQRFLELG